MAEESAEPGVAPEGQTTETETQESEGQESVLGQAEEQAPDQSEATTEGEEVKEGEQAKEGEQEPKEESEALTAEDYTFELPEGFQLDEIVSGEFKTFLVDKQMSKDDAQALMDLHLKVETKKAEDFKNLQAEWIEQAKQDKEIGGSNYDQNLAIAEAALGRIGTPELQSLISSSGFGTHPEVIRLFHKIGLATGEDRIVNGNNAAHQAENKDPVNFYSNSNMNS